MQMKTVDELRDELTLVFYGLKDGTIKTQQAAEMANVAGKMINSAKIQLEYYSARKEQPKIEFLHVK